MDVGKGFDNILLLFLMKPLNTHVYLFIAYGLVTETEII
jgi:hypothetical protein